MKVDWLTPGRLEQLGLGLDAEEGNGINAVLRGGEVDPAEARLRSELARQALMGKQRVEAALAMGQEKPQLSEWTEDYLRLRESGWPWRVAAYIAWAASPKKQRWPEGIDELATEVLGLTGPRVIYSWRKKNPAIDEVVGLMQAAPLLEHRRDVYQALIASASSADHRSNPDRKLFLEIIGDYVPHSKVEVSKARPEDLSTLSEEELALMAGKRLDHGGTEGTEDTRDLDEFEEKDS